MQTRRDPRATFDTYTGCQQRACHDSALGAPSHAQTQDNSDEQLRFKALYEDKRVCDLWEHACPQSFVHKRCMALNTRASARDRTTRVSRRVRACMSTIVSTHALHGPGAAAYVRAVLWSNSPAGTACSWLRAGRLIPRWRRSTCAPTTPQGRRRPRRGPSGEACLPRRRRVSSTPTSRSTRCDRRSGSTRRDRHDR